MALVPVSGLDAPNNLVHELLTANQGILRVINAPAPGGPVLSVFGRTGEVVAANYGPPTFTLDYNTNQIANDTGLPPGPTLNSVLSFMSQVTQPVMFAAPSPAGVAAARFFQRTYVVPTATEAAGQIIMPRASTIRGLTVGLLAALVTDTLTLTVRVNGLATSLVLSLSPGQLFKSTENLTTYNAGDRVSLQITQSGTEPGANTHPVCWIF